MALLQISRADADGWGVVVAAGEVDVASSPSLSRAIDEALATSSRLVVDLAKVSFLDSTGLGVLVHAHNRSEEGDGEVRLVVVDPNVLKVFEVTSLDEVFRIAATRAEAMGGTP